MSHEEMTEILAHMQRYVPCKGIVKTWDMEPYTQTDYQFVTTLVGGDQLSTAHARGCISIQDNAENNFDKLRGLLPVIEDWHAKVCFMQVSFCSYSLYLVHTALIVKII